MTDLETDVLEDDEQEQEMLVVAEEMEEEMPEKGADSSSCQGIHCRHAKEPNAGQCQQGRIKGVVCVYRLNERFKDKGTKTNQPKRNEVERK